jgi:alpha-beta hydrolase superfamily lysophospholipase
MSLAVGPEHREHTLTTADGARLRVLSWVPREPRARVIVLHGYGDHAGRYHALLARLAEADIAATAFDFRGHGLSSGPRGFVRAVSSYVDDLEAVFAEEPARANCPEFLFAHSFGAVVALSYLLERQARALAGLILTAPYFRLALQPSRWQLLQARLGGVLLPTLRVKTPLRPEQLSRDPEVLRTLRADSLPHRCVTPAWFNATRAAQAALPQRWSAVRVPLLVIRGDADPIADPTAAREFFDAAASEDKTFISLERGLHEPLNDLERERVLDLVVRFMVERLPSDAAALARRD